MTMCTYLVESVILSLATAAMSMTITKGEIFKPARALVAGAGNKWIAKLVNCPYCLSHTLAIFFVLWYRPLLFARGGIALNLIVTIFAIITLAAVWALVICMAMRTMDKMGGSKIEAS